MQYDLQKFINATLFFAHNVEKLGITKLNKMLYFSDFEHYRLYGKPILGDRYIRMDQGPVPSISYATFNSNFHDDGDDSLKEFIDVKPEAIFSWQRKKIVPKREPDLSVFSQSETEVMKDVARQWYNATAKEVSEQSHLEKPWQETAESGIIDYKLALEQPGSISREYVEYREKEDEALESLLARR